MAKRNLRELEINSSQVFAKKYRKLLGENPNSKASEVFGTLQIEHEQPVDGVVGDILIEGQSVLSQIEKLKASVEFQTFVISLEVARAADIDASSKVAKMVSKVERAIDGLKKPNMREIIETSLQMTAENEDLTEFVVRTF